MEEREKSCMDCENSIWCDTWSEFKCVIKQRRIYEPENDALDCEDFKRERRGKNEAEPKCRCKHCLRRSASEE